MSEFSKFLQEAIRRSGKTQVNIVKDLEAKGFYVNKSTLSRWISGRNPPKRENLGVLRHLPGILNLTPDERAEFNYHLSNLLGVPANLVGIPAFPYREHYLDTLPHFVGRHAQLQN